MSLRVRTYRTDARTPRVASVHPAPPYRLPPHPGETEAGDRLPDQTAGGSRSEG